MSRNVKLKVKMRDREIECFVIAMDGDSCNAADEMFDAADDLSTESPESQFSPAQACKPRR